MSTELTAAAPATERIGPILALLHAEHPDAQCALHHRSPLELLVATILSAQCTDERVNKVTPALFARYPDARAFAEADRTEVEEMIHSTGFYRNKAKNIQESCQRIVQTYDGVVPDNMADLLTLAGVARKTANVVLGTAYQIGDGIVVDTHVRRLAQRLALSTQNDPEKIERDLMAITPRDQWIDLSHLLIFHGRRVCDARKPNCIACAIRRLCPSSQA
ncbi:MAG: endonuclease III [Caldilinea sp.]|uniref:endonuclease III n=1 Tax=Caldilinea sp. TaxID=2293560 RepID=UPI002BD033F0|nr:endonuclease III [Anaerolineales bacterium]HQY93333.1 endonuclease III [Caldilinea sp.]HRA67484.1 endonuclease III [Caldilinea sp.]